MMKRSNSHSGMTLIELTVTIGAAVVIFGLALGILVESDRTTRRMTQIQAATQYCNQALSTAAATIEAAVAAGNIEKTSDTQAVAQTFKADQLQLLAYDRGVLYRTRIGQPQGEGLVLAHEPVGSLNGGGAVVQTTEDLGGLKPAGFTPSIKFAYAGTTPPGQRPKYQDAWTSPGWPALIQVRVEAKVGNRLIGLETSAIPGLVAARPAKEARP